MNLISGRWGGSKHTSQKCGTRKLRRVNTRKVKLNLQDSKGRQRSIDEIQKEMENIHSSLHLDLFQKKI